MEYAKGDLIYIYGGKTKTLFSNIDYPLLQSKLNALKKEIHYKKGILKIVKNMEELDKLKKHCDNLPFGKHNYNKNYIEAYKMLIRDEYGSKSGYMLEFTNDWSQLRKVDISVCERIKL